MQLTCDNSSEYHWYCKTPNKGILAGSYKTMLKILWRFGNNKEANKISYKSSNKKRYKRDIEGRLLKNKMQGKRFEDF